jgi:hypothetical protein
MAYFQGVKGIQKPADSIGKYATLNSSEYNFITEVDENDYFSPTPEQDTECTDGRGLRDHQQKLAVAWTSRSRQPEYDRFAPLF